MDIQSAAEQFNFRVSGTEPLRTVFTAQSKAYFYSLRVQYPAACSVTLLTAAPEIPRSLAARSFICKEAVCEFVFRQSMLPVNPFMAFGYFLGDRVDRDLVRRANNQLISMCDELWVFGDIANGVMFEILLAKGLGKPIRYFTIAAKSNEITEVSLSDLRFESEMSLRQAQIDAFLRLAAK